MAGSNVECSESRLKRTFSVQGAGGAWLRDTVVLVAAAEAVAGLAEKSGHLRKARPRGCNPEARGVDDLERRFDMTTVRPKKVSSDRPRPAGIPVRWVVIAMVVIEGCTTVASSGGDLIATITIGVAIASLGHKVVGR